jgi:branched-chain amino acid transport system ATP-binding protein
MLKVEGINVFYGGIQVLWDVSFSVKTGEVISIVGGNGAGKTTTARAISGLVGVSKGSILLDGVEIASSPCHEILERGLVYVPEGRQLFTEMTVFENLELGAFGKEAISRMDKSLERIYEWFPKLREREDQLTGTLSGGEQQMLAIARGYMSLPRIIILDEPSLGLAPNLVDNILEVVKDLSKEGMTIILVEQDVRKALKVSDRGYVLENGVVKLEGSATGLLNNHEVKKAYLGV